MAPQISIDFYAAQAAHPSLMPFHPVAYYVVHAPEHTSLEAMVKAAGQRWPVEECFESAKGEVGLGDYEVRTYTALLQEAWVSEPGR